MAREFGFRDIGVGLGTSTRLKHTPALVHLVDVIEFLSWIRKNSPWIQAGIALQGLAGLQMQEAMRLTWEKIDLENGLIEISGEVKNEYRLRVIPVCSLVQQALQDTWALHSKIFQEPEEKDFVVLGYKGKPFTEFRHYSSAVRKHFRRWKPDIDWAPKDLRNALPTFATMQGFHGPVLEQYIGHSPKTVTSRHYVPKLTVKTKGEALVLKERMELFREQVLKPIEEVIQEQGSGTT